MPWFQHDSIIPQHAQVMYLVHQRSSMVLFLVAVGCWLGMGRNDVANMQYTSYNTKKCVIRISVICTIFEQNTKYLNIEISKRWNKYIHISKIIYIYIDLIFGAAATSRKPQPNQLLQVHSASPWTSLTECRKQPTRSNYRTLLPWTLGLNSKSHPTHYCWIKKLTLCFFETPA